MLLPLKSCAFSARNNQVQRPNTFWWTFAFRTSVAAVSRRYPPGCCAGIRTWKFTAFIIIALFAVVSIYAQEGEEAESPFHFGMSIGIGTSSFEEAGATTSTTYQKLSLSPDISIGKFGLGLDITLNYTFTGPPDGNSFYVRKEDWIPTGNATFFDVYLPKFKYIRYGFKGEPLYAKLGSIDDATLGNGFIMGNYANTLFLPELRIMGLSFDLDGALFNFPVIGIETFTANLARFDVIGVRPYVRPLGLTEIPILKNLQIGGTLAVDTQPGLYKGGASMETVALYGADIRLPLLSSPAITLAIFGDLAFLHQVSTGGMVGFGGRLIGFLDYGAQIRILGNNFIPTYFDASYDLFRYEKYQIAKGGATVPGYVGWLASLGTSFLEEALVLNVSVDGPFNQPAPGDTSNYLNYPHIYAIFLIKEGILPGISFDASYDKRLIRTFNDLIRPEDAVIKARINYRIGPAVISFVYKIRYEPDPNPGEDPWVVTSGLESTIQLF